MGALCVETACLAHNAPKKPGQAPINAKSGCETREPAKPSPPLSPLDLGPQPAHMRAGLGALVGFHHVGD